MNNIKEEKAFNLGNGGRANIVDKKEISNNNI